jgi:hypothetical protein
MILSGYLLQISVHPDWRKAWIVLHVSTSLLWLLSFVVHQAAPILRAASARRSTEPGLGGPERAQER